MTRALFAALGLIIAASSVVAAEVKILDRMPLAHGAEVVMAWGREEDGNSRLQYTYHTKAGTDWMFFREPVSGEESLRRRLPEMAFTDKRVTLYFRRWLVSTVVTLEHDPVAPVVYEDKFNPRDSTEPKYARLKGADELVFSRPSQSLRRNAEGVWWSEHPLGDISWYSAVARFTPEFKLYQITFNQWSETYWWDPFEGIPHSGICWAPPPMVKRERLHDIRDLLTSFHHFRTQTPSMSAWFQEPMFLVPNHWQNFSHGTLEWPPSFLIHSLYGYSSAKDDEWIQAADMELLRVSTDYDKTLGTLMQIYEAWKEYHDMHLLKTMGSADDPAFLFVKDWGQARARMAP